MITIISATNRPGNLSLLVAQHYQALASAEGLATEVLDLQQLPQNLQELDCYGRRTESFRQFQQVVDDSETLVFVVPEYNGSFPGILKLFIDACDYPGSWRGKKAALVGISAGKGGNVVGLNHLKDVLDYLKLETMPQRVHIPNVRERLVKGSLPTAEAELLVQIQQVKQSQNQYC